MKRKRRWGDRSDGRLLRTLSPMAKVAPYIMKKRFGAQNMMHDSVDIAAIDDYIRQKRRDGLRNFGVLHVLVAAYVRTVAKLPGINRFISGQKIYARNEIDAVMTIKTEMTLEAPDTEIKLTFAPDATAQTVYDAFSACIAENRAAAESGDSAFEKTARILNYIPGLVLQFSIGILRFLDYFGLLSRKLMKISPFHGSFVITSMGSLGIPPIFHHLYDFGNIPVFIAYGAKKHAVVMKRGETTAELRKFLDFTVVTDERVCDGFYFAAALKYLRTILENPTVLDTPPETIVEDVD